MLLDKPHARRRVPAVLGVLNLPSPGVVDRCPFPGSPLPSVSGGGGGGQELICVNYLASQQEAIFPPKVRLLLPADGPRVRERG